VNTTVAEVMTPTVVSVPDTAGFREMVNLIEEHRVSALPVVDSGGRVAGVVSEADLMLKEEPSAPADRHGAGGRANRVERVKAGGRIARDLMTSPALVIGPHASVRTAARLMHERGVKRLPVVDDGGLLVGIVTRSDVLKVFQRDDEQIRREVVDYVIQGLMMVDATRLTVEVSEGVVSVTGEVEHLSDARIMPRLCGTVDGVVGVESRIEYRYEDEKSRERPGVWTTP
jgi:CBS-domain-containing membrane protein